MTFERISVDHRIMGGVPCIRGTRIPVTTVVGMVAEGMTTDDIIAAFPQLAPADIRDALRYAAAAVDERELAAAGHDAVHLAHLGLLGAANVDVMAAASEACRCSVSVDTDFGELLALGRHRDPSVVPLRRAPHHPAEQAVLLLTAVENSRTTWSPAPSSC